MDVGSELEEDDIITQRLTCRRRTSRRIVSPFLVLLGCLVIAFHELNESPRVEVAGSVETKSKQPLLQPDAGVVSPAEDQAREVHESTAIKKKQELSRPDNDASPQSSSTRAATHVAYRDTVAASEARAFVESRKTAYHAKGLDYRWKLRGVGYLYTTHNLILLAELPQNPVVGTRQQITIRNVSNQTTTECSKLTLWARANGPEILAGSATAVEPKGGECYWTFDFDLRIPGVYQVDVKILIWDGKAPIGGTPESQCKYETGPPPDDKLEQYKHDGFQGFKMYKPAQMCCEVCARTPGCVYWATPFFRLENPAVIRNGCELFFDKDAPEDAIPQSSLWPRQQRRRLLAPATPYHGPVHSNPTSYFCGCGWSFWFTLDFGCLSGFLDDRVYSIQSNFTAVPSATTRTHVKPPFCTLDHELFGPVSQGRWVREPYPNGTACPEPYTTAPTILKMFPMTKFDPLHPHCWHRDDISTIGKTCHEMNCAIMDRSAEWMSALKQENPFFGVWRPYRCNYMEYTTAQLQECITRRKIVAFSKIGQSIAAFINEFVQHRLEHITLYEDRNDPEALTIVFDTLAMMHMNGPDGQFEDTIRKLPVVPKNEEHYWISGYFLSSEREVHTHVSRIEDYHRKAPSILLPKNYKVINAFDLSAAFTYDAATQMDGMHLIGPPAKMIVTKLFHHVCSNVIDGSLV